MEIEELMKEWRIWVLLSALAVSMFFLGPSYVGSEGMDAADVTVEGSFVDVSGAEVLAQGGDGGQSNAGGDGGDLVLRYSRINEQGLSTSLEGGSGGPAGILGSEGEDGSSGSVVRSGPAIRFNPEMAGAVETGESFSVDLNVSNRGYDSDQYVSYISGDSVIDSEIAFIPSGSSTVFSFENPGIDSEGFETQVFSSGTSSRSTEIYSGGTYLRPEIEGYAVENGTAEVDVEVVNLGTSGSSTVSFFLNGENRDSEELELENGETENLSFSASYSAEESLNLSAMGAETDSRIEVLSGEYFAVEIQGAEVGGLDDDRLNINTSIENLGKEEEQTIELQIENRSYSEQVELDPGQRTSVIFEHEFESRGYLEAELSSDQESDSERVLAGEEGEVLIEIEDTRVSGDSLTANISVENTGDVRKQQNVFFRSSSELKYRQVELQPGESDILSFSSSAGNGIQPVESWSLDSYDAETVNLIQDARSVSGEVCGTVSGENLVIEDVEVCESGVSFEANDSILVGEDAKIDAAEKNSGRGAVISLEAEKVRIEGEIDTGGRSASGEDISIRTEVKKGLDLQGGTRVLLGVEGNTTESEIETIGNIIQQRVSAFGLTQANVRTVDLGSAGKRIQVEVATTNQTQLRNLISQEGKFEARMPFSVRDTQEFELDQTYEFSYGDGRVSVDGQELSEGDRIKLGGTSFIFVNQTNGAARMEVVAYNGTDIEGVLTSQSRISRSGQSYSFTFPIVLRQQAAERVRTIAQNYQSTYTDPRSGSPYLGSIGGTGPAQLALYVDGERQSSLRMGAVFRSQVVSQPSINGGGETEEAARADMRELQAILQSGSLPSPVEIQSISTISSSLGSQFMSAAIISIVFSLVAVGGLIFIRYRDPRLVVPIVITGASEVFILLGSFFSTIITLDLASIAGIIAAVGTGVDDQIIITDESGKDIVRDWKKRLKRAFFVIFTSAASTIGAMMPIVSPSISNLAIGAAGIGIIGYTFYRNRLRPHYVAIGALAITVSAFTFTLNPSGFALQSVRGFAITTILGVLVGISITRPAYAKMLEYLEN